jgi:3-methyladenine DNA glycosylase/8-oxoguanine DNA glycosylase
MSSVLEASRSFDASGVDIDRALWNYALWPTDPTTRRRPRHFERACLTPSGPGTLHISHDGAGRVDVRAYGDGAEWLCDSAPGLCGADDDPSSYTPSQPWFRDMHRRHPGLRLTRSGLVWQELLVQVLGQRITTDEAAEQWTRLVRAVGEPAPGPSGLRLPPTPQRLSAMGYYEFHRFDIERKRALALQNAARFARQLEAAALMDPQDAIARICAVPGLGPWSATSVVGLCHGDPDVIVLGDFGVPSIVSWTLANERRGDDARMLELLESERPHRARALKLVFAGGSAPPRRAPRPTPSRIGRL